MNKLQMLKTVNTLLFLSFIVQAATVLIILLKVKLPHMAAVFEIHEYNGLLLIALVITHLTLNWGWVRANIFKSR